MINQLATSCRRARRVRSIWTEVIQLCEIEKIWTRIESKMRKKRWEYVREIMMKSSGRTTQKNLFLIGTCPISLPSYRWIWSQIIVFRIVVEWFTSHMLTSAHTTTNAALITHRMMESSVSWSIRCFITINNWRPYFRNSPLMPGNASRCQWPSSSTLRLKLCE